MNTSWSAKPHDAQTAARIIFADHRYLRIGALLRTLGHSASQLDLNHDAKL